MPDRARLVPGTVLAQRYRIVRPLGRGGMGEVLLAEQEEPVRRRVALKVIKAGMDTERVVTRFEAERQALALMDHPGIARIYDAGATEQGCPYFVMEYIEGEPITAYCDRQRLTMDERLDLFRQVCEGVQHAHQKAIIHRDIKPSNVLVMLLDGKAVPKIIDFGVAKATAQPLTEESLHTELGMLVGTPEFMSPEQLDLTTQDVDTRTDVYGLGVLLYELLVGALPFEPEQLRQAGLDGMRKMIREVEPPRPSARLDTLGAERSTDAARRRRVDVSTLRGQLSGDLDWIALKALDKDRSRRYGSPAELAADIDRHRCHEPVTARPPSAVYRARKFVRRHRFGVAAATVGVMVPILFGLAMTVQARRIAREAESKARVAEFLQELFRVSDPSEARGNSITARELLDRGAERIRESLADDPEMRADLSVTIGGAYRSLGLYAQAESLLEDALETRRRILGPEHRRSLTLAGLVGWLYIDQERYQEAETLLRETLAKQERVVGPRHLDTLATMNLLANILRAQGRHAEAEALYRKVLDGRKRVLGPEHPNTLTSMSNLALSRVSQGQYAEAGGLHREILAVRERVLGPDHPDTLDSMHGLAEVYFNQGRHAEAESLYRELLDGLRRVLGSGHIQTHYAIYNLACIVALRGDGEGALGYLREAVEHGFSYAQHMAEDPDLEILHGDPEFEAIIARARKNQENRSSEE